MIHLRKLNTDLTGARLQCSGAMTFRSWYPIILVNRMFSFLIGFFFFNRIFKTGLSCSHFYSLLVTWSAVLVSTRWQGEKSGGHIWKRTENQCNQCDFASSRAGDLRRHLKTHIGEKSNKCNQCDFASTQAGDLRRHLKTHSGEKSSKCNLLRQGPRLTWDGEPD